MNDEGLTQLIAKMAEETQQRRLKAQDEPVEQFFSSKIPPKLWHYTSVSSFEAILASGKMWATEARHTSDTTEFIHAREIALTVLKDLQPRTKAEAQARHYCLQIVEDDFENGTLSSKGSEVFLISFSDAQDLKSQWNEYADKGTGVSVAFDLRNSRPPHKANVAVTFAPCIYDRGHSEWLMQAALKHLFEATDRLASRSRDSLWLSEKLNNWKRVDKVQGVSFDRRAFKESIEQLFSTDLRTAVTLTKYDLLRISAHCKNPYYSEEREWRLSLPHTKGKPLINIAIEYRGPQGDIPYVAHDLFSVGPLPITEVILGPNCDRGAAVLDALKRHGYEVPLRQSGSPQRRARVKCIP